MKIFITVIPYFILYPIHIGTVRVITKNYDMFCYSEEETWLSCLYFDIYENYKFHIQAIWSWKHFVNLRIKYLLTITFKHCPIGYSQFQIQMGILFVCLFDFIPYVFNQQLFSYVGTGLGVLNQY